MAGLITSQQVRNRAVVLLAVVLALSASPAVADVKAGIDAWNAGDYSKAVSEWELPAKQGDADALFNLAQAYRFGLGVDTDLVRARDLYAEAAEKGHVKAADNYGLLLFQLGEPKTAMPFILAAADRGDPRAQYVVGLAHFNADHATRDWERAYALMILANAAGLPQAKDALVQMEQYVPAEQQQQARMLAVEIEAEVNRRRAAGSLANVAPQPPQRVAVTKAEPAPEPAGTRVAEQAAVPIAGAAANTGVPEPEPEPKPEARSGTWRVQLGAFGVPGNADRLWTKLADNPALAGTQKKLVPAGRLTVLQAEGFADQATAKAACTALKQQGQECVIAGN